LVFVCALISSDFTLLAFGGAAPAHVCDVAQRLGIRDVRVPVGAGVLSALGCLASPVSFDFVFGYMRELKQIDWASVNARFAALEREGRQHLAEAGIRDGVTSRYSADMRYLSQRYEVNVALPLTGTAQSRKCAPWPSKLRKARNAQNAGERSAGMVQ